MEIKDLKVVNQKPMSGFAALFLNLTVTFASILVSILGGILIDKGSKAAGIILLIVGILCFAASCIIYAGLRIVPPNHALVLELFGNYYRTIEDAGFFFVNPFSNAVNPAYDRAKSEAEAKIKAMAMTNSNAVPAAEIDAKKSISLKAMTLDNGIQKVNDVLGNPIVIGAVVIWRVTDPTKAVFNVENYRDYISIQTDSTVRNIARLYPYDVVDDDDDDDNSGKAEKTLRGSSLEIADSMKVELEKRVAFAGLAIEEVRITHLAYSEEIAAAMLQRQQASAIIAARKKIVDGAVSMVKMAIDSLSEEEIVVLDEERKAQMVSNLLVVLCSNKDTQPIVNSGSIY